MEQALQKRYERDLEEDKIPDIIFLLMVEKGN